MKRLAIEKLIKWNKDENKKPLIIWGARQVGKTYLVKEIFAEMYYNKNYIYIDYKIEDKINDFCSKTANAAKIIEFISLNKGRPIDENTLLIFDEIQECPNIISALKYFCQDFRNIPVIATGSMVRIKLQRIANKRGKRETFLFPVGKIDQITIYPMTFDEFLMNNNAILYEKLYTAYKDKQALEPEIHELAMDQIYRYLLIGGMPEVVNEYIENKDLLKCKEILTSLYDNYLSDMELYQASREAILRSRKLFSNIYNQLSKESKNFSPGLIETKSRNRDFVAPIDWLTMAHLINQSFQLKEHVTLPLIKNDDSNFRLYLSDIGMFSYQSKINASSFISNEGQNTLSGIFFENFVSEELIAKGNELYYWKGKNNSEIEFIIESNNKLYPIDVKKGKGVLNSLGKFANHNKFEYAIKLSSNNFGIDQNKKLITIPIYFISFLSNDFSMGNLNY